MTVSTALRRADAGGARPTGDQMAKPPYAVNGEPLILTANRAPCDRRASTGLAPISTRPSPDASSIRNPVARKRFSKKLSVH